MFPVLYRNIFPVIAYIYINYVSVAATTLIGKFFRYAPVGRCGPSVLHFWPYPALCAHNILCTIGERGDSVYSRYEAELDAIKRGYAHWRRVAGGSQRRIARACGVSRATVARWDDVATPYLPDVCQLVAMAKEMRWSPEEAMMWIVHDGLGSRA